VWREVGKLPWSMSSTSVGYKSNKLEAGKLQVVPGACLAGEADFECVVVPEAWASSHLFVGA